MSVYRNDKTDDFKLALDSVSIKQTLKPNQIVIVEDGPIETEIEEVINVSKTHNPDIEFTIIKKAVNQGLAAALNDGIKACRFEWIARMDADDVARPIRFEYQINYLEKHPYIDVLGGNVAEFESTPRDINSVRRVPQTHQEIATMAKSRNPINHQTVFYKKTSVEAVGNYSVEFGKLEDYKLWVDMLVAGFMFANLDEILVDFRIGKGFIERRSNKREIKDWDMLQAYLLRNKMIDKKTEIINKISIRCFIYMPSWLKVLAYKHILRKH